MLCNNVRVTAPRSRSLSKAPGSASQPQINVPPVFAAVAAAPAERAARSIPVDPSANERRKRRRVIERPTANPSQAVTKTNLPRHRSSAGQRHTPIPASTPIPSTRGFRFSAPITSVRPDLFVWIQWRIDRFEHRHAVDENIPDFAALDLPPQILAQHRQERQLGHNGLLRRAALRMSPRRPGQQKWALAHQKTMGP